MSKQIDTKALILIIVRDGLVKGSYRGKSNLRKVSYRFCWHHNRKLDPPFDRGNSKACWAIRQDTIAIVPESYSDKSGKYDEVHRVTYFGV